MPPKKKCAPNGFMVFTFDWKNQNGGGGMSMATATAEAGRIWKDMTAQERGPYNERAKNDKVKSRSRGEKLTCTGMPVALVQKEKLDVENRDRRMKRQIETTVRNSVKNSELDTQSYFFIMVNYFTKTLKGGVYVPAEISVSEYSLKEGVCRKYHSLINPGNNVFGHLYEAKHHMETTHKLPLPPHAMGESNLARIYNDILNFIRDRETGDYPPVYTYRDCMPIVESALDYLKADEGANQIDLNVYSLQYLFYILKEATSEMGEVEKPHSHYLTDAYFENDFFEYQTGIACQFHEDNDKSKYCTQSCVTRWGFMFSDYMCRDIAISLIPGRHVPESTNLAAIINPAPSSICDDSASYISMGTEASYVTKALSEHKIYYDDQKTMVSQMSNPNSSAKRFNADEDFHSLSSRKKTTSSISNSDDFPSLGARPKKVSNSSGVAAPSSTSGARIRRSSAKHETDTKPCIDSDDGVVDDLNPWASRSRHTPREPDTSDFTVNYTRDDLSDTDDFNSVASFGRGRGLLNRSFNSTVTSGRGRGSLFRP